MQRQASRRAFLSGMTATAAAVWAGAAPRGASAAGRQRQWVDVHHHFIPPGYREFFQSARNADGSPAVVPPTNWALSADLEDMERAGVRTAILSMFVPPTVGTSASRASLARAINEGAARLVADHAGRFASFAALPLPDIDTSLAEVAYAADTLKARGFAVYTNVGDRWIGDRAFDPLFAELDRRRAVLFVHPVTAACCQNLLPGVPDNIIEYQTDTTRAIASVAFGGVTTRFPGIQFLFSHGGGTMPYLIERFLGGTAAQIVPGVTTPGQGGPYVPKQPAGGVLAHLRRLHYDTAQCANPVAMRALRTVAGSSQIVFGTDYFYRTAAETVQGLESCGVFDGAELDAVAHGNAARLLRLEAHR
ncbi:MAG: amidohydrolase [Gammaproteobacteria bacterium]|nr:amidohydrolase [Gammaproteobacteria bacterium]